MNFKTIFKSFKNKEMRKRIFAVVGILVVYRILAHVPVPLGDANTFKEAVTKLITSTDLGGFLNLISGGGLTNFSIILVGLSPYITSSIVMQLLTKAIPQMEELNNDGETGRRKIAQWTRILTVPLAIMQSFAYVYILFQQVVASNTATTVTLSSYDWAVAVTAMTAGSILLMWLGELITEQGIGNGISTVILCSIISGLPGTMASLGERLFSGSMEVFGVTIPVDPAMLGIVVGLVVGLIVVLYFIVKINEAQRIITINYAKRVHETAHTVALNQSCQSSSLRQALCQSSLPLRSYPYHHSLVKLSNETIQAAKLQQIWSTGSRHQMQIHTPA